MTTDSTTPTAHRDTIQIGDYVEILPINDREGGLAVYGYVQSYQRMGNLYTVTGTDGQPRRVTGSRLIRR